MYIQWYRREVNAVCVLMASMAPPPPAWWRSAGRPRTGRRMDRCRPTWEPPRTPGPGTSCPAIESSVGSPFGAFGFLPARLLAPGLWIRIRIQKNCWIRIRKKWMQIHSPDYRYYFWNSRHCCGPGSVQIRINSPDPDSTIYFYWQLKQKVTESHRLIGIYASRLVFCDKVLQCLFN